MIIREDNVRKQIRNLIIEAIGDAKQEYALFGEELVEGLRSDPELNKAINSPEDFKEYMKRKYGLDRIGKGHFRQVYNTKNKDLIIKFASSQVWNDSLFEKTITAMDANLQEVQRFNRYPDFFPKVYASHPQGFWVIMEKAKHVPQNVYEMLEIINKTFPVFKKIEQDIPKIIKNIVLDSAKEEREHLENILDLALEETNNGNWDKVHAYSLFKDIIEENEKDKNSNLKEVIEFCIGQRLIRITQKIKDNCMKILPDSYTRNYDKNITSYLLLINFFDISFILKKLVKPLLLEFLRDRNFIGFCNMLINEKINTFDIAPRNVGKNEKGKLILIDATAFENVF